MFSPGWSLDATYYIYAGTRLASHGFVVAVLTYFARQPAGGACEGAD